MNKESIRFIGALMPVAVTGALIGLIFSVGRVQPKPANIPATAQPARVLKLERVGPVAVKAEEVVEVEPEVIRFYTSNYAFLGATVRIETDTILGADFEEGVIKAKTLPLPTREPAVLLLQNPGGMKYGYRITITFPDGRVTRFFMLDRVTDHNVLNIALLIDPCYGMVPEVHVSGTGGGIRDQFSLPDWLLRKGFVLPKPPSADYGCIGVDYLTPFNY